MTRIQPSKIVCVGRNYAKHAAELGNDVPVEPLIFLKPPSSLVFEGDDIVLPQGAGRVDFEGEIGVIIGRRARNVAAADAWDCVEALIAVNDVTARDLQRTDGQWTRAKGFDSFCPVGTPIPLAEVDRSALGVRTRVNGEVRQDGPASDMVFDIPAIIAHISSIMTLEPGDLIATGTPDGIGPLSAGDEVVVEIVGVGSVTNRVVAGH
ncbi:MAG: fumarylacetoacetate hydrolase family protein [Gemmatimonadetes bacterium]|nr:fumarylacetoacetate hydrolase family protein [Gemmatimonadota bacterium]MDA1103623.1 fumarylacetoacetate hydrolase family protein [Gemmatimonadota bacterium]